MRRYFENGVTVIDTGIKDPTRVANTGHHGVHELAGGKYQVCLARTYIGVFQGLDEAVAARKEAERQHKAGTLKEWVKELRRDRRLMGK